VEYQLGTGIGESGSGGQLGTGIGESVSGDR
jgi:hypothetical protein